MQKRTKNQLGEKVSDFTALSLLFRVIGLFIVAGLG